MQKIATALKPNIAILGYALFLAINAAFTMVLSNLKIIPAEDTTAYDIVWGWVVPLAIPMLLFKADLKKVWKESGRLIRIYLLSGLGTILGAFIAFFLLKNDRDRKSVV